MGVFEMASSGFFEQSSSHTRFAQHWEIMCFGPGEAVLSRRGAECQRHLPESG